MVVSQPALGGKPMKKVLDNLYEAIGNTPAIRLHRLTRHYGVKGNIFAKVEYMNPGFSKKDRPALKMIEDAEAAGLLKPGQTVVELTSGNLGTAFAIVCGNKGYHFVACMSEGNSQERARVMRALGAEVILVKQAGGYRPGQVSGEDLALVEKATRKLVEERGALRLDQFYEKGSATCHKLGTARELWEQCGGKIDAFCDIPGSGGSFVGCASGFKELDPQVKCYLVEPVNAARYAGYPVKDGGKHKIQGCGYYRELPKLEERLMDGCIQVTDEEAIEAARNVARLEGAFVGYSSGANVAAALKLLHGEQAGKNIAVLLPDSGLKYMENHDLYA